MIMYDDDGVQVEACIFFIALRRTESGFWCSFRSASVQIVLVSGMKWHYNRKQTVRKAPEALEAAYP